MQDFVAATLQAWFRRCGVASSSLKRYASYSQPELVANQWTLRRCGACIAVCCELGSQRRHAVAVLCSRRASCSGAARPTQLDTACLARAAAPCLPRPACRVAPLPEGYDWRQYREWAPDFCPLADEACY